MIVNSLYPPYLVGGAEKSVSLYAEALSRAGDEVTVVTLHPKPEIVRENLNGVSVIRLPMLNHHWPFSAEKRSAISRIRWHARDSWNKEAAAQFGAVLDAERPEVVHTNNLTGLSAAVWEEVKDRGIRLVHTMRDYYMLCARSALFRKGETCEKQCSSCKLFSRERKKHTHLVDAVIANSQYMLDLHTAWGYFLGTPASVIFNISDSAISPKATGSHSQELAFGYMGRVEPEKGVEVLLEATRSLERRDWKLKIAGVGERDYVADLQSRYPDPNIEWLGFASPADFYASIHVAIIPSIWPEPLPRTAINAFAAGLAALCSDAGGTPEIARLGKKTEVYPARNAKALSTLMENALRNRDEWLDGGWKNPAMAAWFEPGFVVNANRSLYHASSEPFRYPQL